MLAYLKRNCRYFNYFLREISYMLLFHKVSMAIAEKKEATAFPQQSEAFLLHFFQGCRSFFRQRFQGAGRVDGPEERSPPGTSPSETKWKKGMSTITFHPSPKPPSGQT